jgi:hypothetical protein
MLRWTPVEFRMALFQGFIWCFMMLEKFAFWVECRGPVTFPDWFWDDYGEFWDEAEEIWQDLEDEQFERDYMK